MRKYKLALLAKNMKHSVLPKAYDYIGAGLGFEVDFEICNVDEDNLSAMVSRLKESCDGFTVTMPYKTTIIDYCDTLDESAEKCGSANTILVQDNRLIGYNTDGWGLVNCLKLKGIEFKGKQITMTGAGGVALSIAYNLLINDAESVAVVNIFPDEAQRLVERMGSKFTAYPLDSVNLIRASKNADVYINASLLGQLGFNDYEDFAFLDVLKKDAVVYDVNYANPDAGLPREAKKRGLRVYIGNTMSAFQGIRAMEIWTGKRLDDEKAIRMVELVESHKL
ncbi:MAG: shikimate dehydrogenase [Clostridiales bacterium]|nr:shikimate dehydrogenase [Clostridiales bacterium]